MQIAKKAALLAATAGTLVLLGTGTAAAEGYGGGSDRNTGTPTSIDISSFIFQKNDCDTLNGGAYSIGGAAPSGDVTIGSTCLNNIGG
ncbi:MULTISPECIES: hypothetical protein [Streptomyces]|uniref:Chaplin domain-containing protein n=3 Tax=Streptomyces TaxID=1883 RepID=A0ABD5J774_9ACTN|nr:MULTISPECIES: hypothetical protein [Streptomyces]MEE4584116.1 hypothetical protein [Streptomyces sp. DSM 41602]AJZ84290.1 hypothetical protein AS97_20480 [Streptomyces sp. AgN23]RSS37017.1 hypothetical protein EF902_33855 [Streptomyces sp. WAC05858]WTA78921.1 hypothetical protein OG751_02445 [Streptomyces antimycoticus]WTB10745.1 hypothetical protein OG546_45345 [Streptomyces antimycoticus]